MKYSIITPVYNREDCIARCIESILRQKNLNELDGEIEHIIINDGSNDSTDAICKKYAKKNNIIKYISFSENKGTNAARNAGIKIASGTFCIILDSDDYFVDNAISIINKTIISRPNYRHYMFAPNDIDYGKSILSGYKEKELSYQDFLSGQITTGFIHCIDSNIMKSFPFDEYIRIHEGVFFLSFYKESQKMLFTNKIVTIRERGRSDSVTLDAVRTKKIFIKRTLKADEIMISQFGHDMNLYKCNDMLSKLYINMYDNYLLLGAYKKIIQLSNLYQKEYTSCILKSHKLKILQILYFLRLGIFYRYLLQVYLIIKYKVFKIKIQ